jgi:hypothetical protein
MLVGRRQKKEVGRLEKFCTRVHKSEGGEYHMSIKRLDIIFTIRIALTTSRVFVYRCGDGTHAMVSAALD